MSRILLIPMVATLVAASWSTRTARSNGEQIKPRADAPQPHSPEESQAFFQLPDGFRIELVASEPYVADPVAVAFDPQGRIFVCEIHGYNLDGHLDVTELNKTGVLDEKVRRIPANPEAIRRAEEMTYGTVKRLEDTDGDGRVDRCTVWADKLPACYGVVAAGDGVIVICAPDIVYLADCDGDGKPEVQEKLFTGFGSGELWTRINNPRWGVDNWIYVAHGGNPAGTVRGDGLAADVHLGSVSFRFKSDGTAIEAVGGRTGGFGLALSDWGDRFVISNSAHAQYVVPLPYRYLARNPYYAAPNPVVNIADYDRVYPTSQPHPWRTERNENPQWVKFYGQRETTANGYFTAVCGQAIYRAGAFPAEYCGNHFSCESSRNLVHRCLLRRDGSSFTAERAPAEQQREFLTSSEQWFRPVNATTGPHGALYIVDMYREIIEDYSAIPRYLQQQYGLIKGDDRGRIWRVVADRAPKPRKFDLAKATTAELLGELSHRNAWRRQTAQRLLIQRCDKAALKPLVAVTRQGKTPQARLHALYTLDGLDALQPAAVEHALDDDHYAIRVHALRMAEKWLHETPSLLQKILRMIDDPDPKVRLQLALTLGQSKDTRAVRALSQLAARYADERWMHAAVLSSVADSAAQMLAEILQHHGDLGKSQPLARPLASIVGARRNHEEIGKLLSAIAQVRDENLAALQVTCLDGLIEGLQRGKPQMLRGSAGQLALRRLMVSPSLEVQEHALHVAALVRLREAPEIKAALAAAGKVALDERRTTEDRQLAVALLMGAPFSEVGPIGGKLLDPRQPLDIQLAAIRVLASVDDPRAGSILLANWTSYTPKARNAVIDAIFSRQTLLPALLDALERGAVQPSSLDTIRQVWLRENPDEEIRRRANSLLASQSIEKDRQELLTRYRAALAGPRSAQRGEQVYEKQCAKCHRLDDQGFEVGADLTAANNRADETLVADILDPSAKITVGYRNYTVITEDGRIFTGVLAAETATSITLRREEAAEDTILRKDIDEMAASELSIMPEGLEKEVTPQNVADLIAFLRKTLGPLPPPRAVLFEDERAFVDALTEGGGTATLRSDDRFSGKASLAITPLQRHSARIPGWEYRIAEDPAPGEFRYLRFAWKSSGGEGVMIELAADGVWPPADRPLHRYYSGKNTTAWQAVEVASQAPTEWVVVTRDLWKDFGTFTLTGIAPTALGDAALFDRIELLRSLDEVKPRPQ